MLMLTKAAKVLQPFLL